MRFWVAAAATGLAGCSAAERLIAAPVGVKIRSDETRIEHVWTAGDPDRGQWIVGMGVGLAYDFEIVYERAQGSPRGLTFHGSFNLLPPVVDFAPGISFGMLDMLNQTRDGRSPYVAISFRYAQFGDFNVEAPVLSTIGMRGGKHAGLFTSVELPFADSFRLLVEHDAIRLTAGVELRPVRGLVVRWLFRQEETMLGVQVRWRS
jgi:hypothetical protein